VSVASLAALEEAADEIARLDLLCAKLPGSFAQALRTTVLAELSRHDADATPQLIAAADADTLHEAALPPATLAWRDLLADEERRARGGASLSVARLDAVAPSLGTYPNRPKLEAIWRESGRGRPVLARVLDAVAWFPEGDERAADATAALLLCAGGRTDRIRLLPFIRIPASERAAAIEAWRSGDEDEWTGLGLAAAAHRARALRALARVAAGRREEEVERVAAMGRAGINAARALDVVRETFATTMPVLADDLSLSRPAAAAALERLLAAGLLREVTGRARDRVYAYEAALVVAERARAV